MSKHKIWFQGATDRGLIAPALPKSTRTSRRSSIEPDFTFTINTTTPPVTTTHALTEFRAARNFIRNVIEAERQGYDAVAIDLQDAGLMEAKAAVDIPVIGLGETTLFHACTLGRKLGLVTINPAFIPWHEDQVIRYRIQDRVVGVRAVDAKISDYIDAFARKEAFEALYPMWERECRVLLDAGADVIVPAGGIPMMLFGGGTLFDAAPVVNGMTLIAKTAEMIIKLRELGGAHVLSRRSNFARPPEKALREFIEQG